MNAQPEPACLIRAKVLIGQLPRRSATRSWVTDGTGLSCDGCDRAIMAGDVEHAVDAIGLGTLRFHTRCMQLWEEASAIPRDIAGGSGPSPFTLALDVGLARPVWRSPHAFREFMVAATQTVALASRVRALSRGVRARSTELVARAARLRRVGPRALLAVALAHPPRARGWLAAIVVPRVTQAWQRCTQTVATVSAHARPWLRDAAPRRAYAAAIVVLAIGVATGLGIRPIWNVRTSPPSPPEQAAPASPPRVAAPPPEVRRPGDPAPRRVQPRNAPRLARVTPVTPRGSGSSRSRVVRASRQTQPASVWREMVYQSP